MINLELRKQGIGASECAAILGMDPRRDGFSIWARKLDLIDEPESNVRMRRGRYFEQGIVQWYSDETGLRTEWSDSTVQHPKRPWQLCTPDAYVIEEQEKVLLRVGGTDAKLVAYDQREHWGESGTVQVPDHYALQNQWTCSTLDQPWWDIAAAIGDELRVYRIHRDPKIEEVLLETIEKWWNTHIVGRTQPPIGATQAAADYLKKRYPKNVQPLKVATPEEAELLAKYRQAREGWDVMEREYNSIENRVKEIIGDAEGILHGPWRVTYKKSADTMGTDWQAVAQDLMTQCCPMDHDNLEQATGCQMCEGTNRYLSPERRMSLVEFATRHQVVTRQGARKIHCAFGKAAKG